MDKENVASHAYTHAHTHIYIMEYYSAIERVAFCHLQQHEWNCRVLCLVK